MRWVVPRLSSSLCGRNKFHPFSYSAGSVYTTTLSIICPPAQTTIPGRNVSKGGH